MTIARTLLLLVISLLHLELIMAQVVPAQPKGFKRRDLGAGSNSGSVGIVPQETKQPEKKTITSNTSPLHQKEPGRIPRGR